MGLVGINCVGYFVFLAEDFTRIHLIWALLPVKPTASGFTDQVFLNWQDLPPLIFACLISRLLDSHPHFYLGLMGLSPRCRLLGLVGKNFPLVFACLISRLFGFSPSYLPGLMGLSPRCRLLGLVGKICPPLSLRASFQGFWILTLISTLGSWGYPQW